MNRIHKYLVKYLIFAFPVIIIMFIWGTLQGQQTVSDSQNMFLLIARELLSWNLILWFLCIVYLVFALVFSPKFRNELLTKITRIKDRDEREQYIIGQSGRFTFLSTLALLLFLLFFSTLEISVNRLPAEKAINGKRHEFSIGLMYSLFENDKAGLQNKEVLFSTRRFRLSQQSIILILIIWHLGSFSFSVYKLKRED